MRSFYLDNFRGFKDALVPLLKTNFLVGENSSGKSSFLKLINMFSRPEFIITPQFIFDDDVGFGGFSDIVSLSSSDKSCFYVGSIFTEKKNGADDFDAQIYLFKFINNSGMPVVSKYARYSNGNILNIVLEKNRIKYRHDDCDDIVRSHDDATKLFYRILDDFKFGNSRHYYLPDEMLRLPLPIIESIVLQAADGLDKKLEIGKMDIPNSVINFNLKWIAPIRTKPQRVYYGIKRSFSSEGNHTPFTLKKTMSLRTKSASFAEKLSKFGAASGLFEGIGVHSYGRGQSDPFELLIKFSGVDFNINNVGYGISQVLPLIVEFISNERHHWFAVQQPEVHLHPKAQAALGELMYELAKEGKHSFLIETHSDYLIDRFRLSMKKDESPGRAQVLFFSNKNGVNSVNVIDIKNNGRYGDDQPKEFREFFIKEEISMLDL
jgi:predicted ATP-dependent endonuclease of OLD family